jgi:hypothetical protein
MWFRLVDLRLAYRYDTHVSKIFKGEAASRTAAEERKGATAKSFGTGLAEDA